MIIPGFAGPVQFGRQGIPLSAQGIIDHQKLAFMLLHTDDIPGLQTGFFGRAFTDHPGDQHTGLDLEVGGQLGIQILHMDADPGAVFSAELNPFAGKLPYGPTLFSCYFHHHFLFGIVSKNRQLHLIARFGFADQILQIGNGSDFFVVKGGDNIFALESFLPYLKW